MTEHHANGNAALDHTVDAKLAETPRDTSPPLDASDVESEVAVADVRRYALLGEVAAGGIGRVFAAEDRTLKRTVAIKELRVANRGQSRFLREAMVTARLQHPSIVPLYDIGRWPSGELYYSMRLVSGRPLSELIADCDSLDKRLALLPHVIAIADAMAYAHSQQIIHRDLKPSNIIVGEFGETVVIDWGLAKDLAETSPEPEADLPYRMPDAPLPLTQAGEVLGTPIYMAPEQATGQALDERADVYAIGAILYEMLTGMWPHRGATGAQVIARLIAGETITPVEDQDRDLPADLAAIVNKAMRYERAERYPSAAELAAELRRFQTGQLVAAHRYSRSTLVRRWVQRHRAAVGVATALMAVLGATVTVSLRSIVRERDATRAERDRLILAQAAGELDRDPTASIAWLKTYPGDGAELGHARELALQARARGVATHVFPRDSMLAIGGFSPDGRWFARPDLDGVQVLDLATGATKVYPAAKMVTWAADGRHLLLAGATTASIVDLDGGVTALTGDVLPLWPSATKADVFLADGSVVVPTHDHQLRRYSSSDDAGTPEWTPFGVDSYSRRGNRVATLEAGAPVWWDASERVAHSLAVPDGLTLATDESAYLLVGDGSRLVAGTTTGQLCVWTLADGKVRVLAGDLASIHQLGASRDGSLVVSVGGDDQLRIWSIDRGTSRAVTSMGTVLDIDTSADGRYLAVGLADHRVMLVDTGTADVHEIGRHAASIRAIVMSRDARWIASGGDDGTIRLWHVPEHPIDHAGERLEFVTAIAVSHDHVAAGGAHAMMWTTGSRDVFANDTAYVRAIAFSGSGGKVVTGGNDQTIRTWDVAGHETGTLVVEAGAVESLAVSRDGNSIASAHGSGDVRVWDVATRTSKLLARIPGVLLIARSPDDRTIAAGDLEGNVHLLAVDGSSPRILHGGSDFVIVTRFSPDGRRVAAGLQSGRVFVWDVATGAPRELARRGGRVIAVAFSADGRHLAATSGGGDVGLWDLETGEERTLVGHAGEVSTVGFTADGLVTGGVDGTVRLWDYRGTSTRTLVRVDGEVNALAIDGGIVVAGASSGNVYRWSLDALGAAAPEPPSPLGPFLDELTHARIDANQRLASP